MNVITKQVEEKPFTVTIEYPILDHKARDLIKKIKSLDFKVTGNSNGKWYSLSISDIFYIEAVERKTFIYTEKEIYVSEKKLYELEEMLNETGIVRISKSCLMNMEVLLSVRQLLNSQLEATMINGEKLLIARTYLKNIKKILKEGTQ
ncbi:MAG: LytTR family transcriptional regulator [Clostridia bacterium]|nr:LytTR family transcriptional regulator [Clostridia bacterium]